MATGRTADEGSNDVERELVATASRQRRRVGAADNELVQSECWFTTSPGGRWTWAAGVVLMEPVGVVHAKRMGTLTTACGLSATSWRKFWDAPFTRAFARGEVACERCAAVISARVSRPTAARP